MTDGFNPPLSAASAHCTATEAGSPTAAAANRLGLKPRLVLVGKKPETATGNLLVDRILGVEEIHYVDYVKGDT